MPRWVDRTVAFLRSGDGPARPAKNAQPTAEQTRMDRTKLSIVAASSIPVDTIPGSLQASVVPVRGTYVPYVPSSNSLRAGNDDDDGDDDEALAQEKLRFLLDYPEYSRTSVLDVIRREEFARLDESKTVYLDYTGAALYPSSLIRSHLSLLDSSTFGNTHSPSPTSALSSSHAIAARDAILAFFDAEGGEWEVILTANASAALRLVAECYDWGRGPGDVPDECARGDSGGDGARCGSARHVDARVRVVVGEDQHNSVSGLAEYAARQGAEVVWVGKGDEWIMDEQELKSVLHNVECMLPSNTSGSSSQQFPLCSTPSPMQRALPLHQRPESASCFTSPSSAGPTPPRGLICFTAQSNLTGARCRPSWLHEARSAGYQVLLDAAALAPSTPISLRPGSGSPYAAADYVAISLYKITGYPTGIGALLVSKRGGMAALRPDRCGFAGGTVDWVDIPTLEYTSRAGHEGFERGTINFLGLPAVAMGLTWARPLLPLMADRLGALAHWMRRQLDDIYYVDERGRGRGRMVCVGPPSAVTGIGRQSKDNRDVHGGSDTREWGNKGYILSLIFYRPRPVEEPRLGSAPAAHARRTIGVSADRAIAIAITPRAEKYGHTPNTPPQDSCQKSAAIGRVYAPASNGGGTDVSDPGLMGQYGRREEYDFIVWAAGKKRISIRGGECMCNPGAARYFYDDYTTPPPVRESLPRDATSLPSPVSALAANPAYRASGPRPPASRTNEARVPELAESLAQLSLLPSESRSLLSTSTSTSSTLNSAAAALAPALEYPIREHIGRIAEIALGSHHPAHPSENKEERSINERPSPTLTLEPAAVRQPGLENQAAHADDRSLHLPGLSLPAARSRLISPDTEDSSTGRGRGRGKGVEPALLQAIRAERLGIIRVSLGLPTNFEDCWRFVAFCRELSDVGTYEREKAEYERARAM